MYELPIYLNTDTQESHFTVDPQADLGIFWLTRGEKLSDIARLVSYIVSCSAGLSRKKSVGRLTDGPDMSKAVDWDVKNQTKQTKLHIAEFVCNVQVNIFCHGGTVSNIPGLNQ